VVPERETLACAITELAGVLSEFYHRVAALAAISAMSSACSDFTKLIS
jgi:hypothetical protein